MRPLLPLDCPLAIRFCLVVTCSLMLALTPSYAERPAEFSERESLSGLSGVKVLTERERLATRAGAVLVVRLDAVHDRIGRYFYSVDLLLKQRVRSGGYDASELTTVTWMKSGGIGVVVDDNVKHVEDQVRRKVDKFIKDYQAVNLDRRGRDQLKGP